MERKTAFIGHREIRCADAVRSRVRSAIDEQIKSGCKTFMVGTHGEFDELALALCREARVQCSDIKIIVVLTSYHRLVRMNKVGISFYKDVETLLYDIENEHYKRGIIVSNRLMIDECDALICYVDKRRKGGAKRALSYAEKVGLRIVNTFREEDDPTCHMTAEGRLAYWTERFEHLK